MEKNTVISIINFAFESLDVEKLAEDYLKKTNAGINQKTRFYKFWCNFVYGHYFERKVNNLKVCKRCGSERIDQ